MRRCVAWMAALSVFALAVACGRTQLDVSQTGAHGGTGGGSPTSSTTTSATSSSTTATSSSGASGGCGACKAAVTCASEGLNCGKPGDGCGCLLDCGTCGAPGVVCGGGGTPNVCGTDCVATTCAIHGYECGMVGDGCEGTLDCGMCIGDMFCGGAGPNKCGFGTCKTCAEQGFQCGKQDDGCGNAVDCGACPAGSICGGGPSSQLGVCGAPTCTSLTCAQQNFNCGQATDKCGHIIDCGTCAGNQICGKFAPNACGASGACTNLCLQQVACPMNGTTTVTGTVFAPNGVDPLAGTLVYVSNAPVQPFTPGVACGDCTSQVSGSPLVSAITGVDGTFSIANMPAGANIPLVIQNGRWRRQFTIPNVPACMTTALPTGGMPVLRMPQTQAEGDIPLMAFVTGFADSLECVLRKIGIADSEFSDPSGNGRVRFYRGDGHSGVSFSPSTPLEDQLWASEAAIDAYDMVFFACQGAQYPKSAAAQTVLRDYADAGGRVFTTHFSYVWLFENPPFSGTALWNVDQMTMFANDPGTGDINMTFPKGLALAEWLKNIYPATTLGQIQLSTLRHDFDGVVPPSLQWITLTDPAVPAPVPMHYTFDTPVGVPPAQQCGRVLYDDFHVEDAMVPSTTTFPTECSSGPMTPQEKMLEFMIFDLGACVKLDVCTAMQTCAQQNVACGPAPDGCGNILQCGACPAGDLCVGGQCVGCTPKTCAQQGFMCGMQDDGCGNVLSCGTCLPNLACHHGVCQPGACTPLSCAAQGFTCGPQGDGCGQIIECGSCPAGELCEAGTCKTPPCTPKSCADQGFNCGLAGDGCSGTIDCGQCTAPSVCGGGVDARPNVCGI